MNQTHSAGTMQLVWERLLDLFAQSLPSQLHCSGSASVVAGSQRPRVLKPNEPLRCRELIVVGRGRFNRRHGSAAFCVHATVKQIYRRPGSRLAGEIPT